MSRAPVPYPPLYTPPFPFGIWVQTSFQKEAISNRFDGMRGDDRTLACMIDPSPGREDPARDGEHRRSSFIGAVHAQCIRTPPPYGKVRRVNIIHHSERTYTQGTTTRPAQTAVYHPHRPPGCMPWSLTYRRSHIPEL